MKSKVVRRKIKYSIGASAIIFVLISGLFYFIVIHRFKESVKYIVQTQTNGKYVFDAGKANISLWSKSLTLQKSVLICKDTSKSNSYYNVKLSKLKFSLTSWNALLFKNKILVDSLEIINPEVEVFSHLQRSKNKAVFRPSEILTFLEKTQQSFNLSNLSIKNASISFKQGNEKSFSLKHINLSIKNFAKVDQNDSHLLGSDHIKLSIGKQSIAIPDRNLTVAFSSLDFNSKNQYFNVDSLLINQKDGQKNGKMEFKADRFSFNSKHLPAAYQKEELLLDTVRCINPILTLYDNKNKIKKGNITNDKLKNEIFKLINIKFFEIENASVLQKKPDGTLKNSAGKTANLTAYNLSLQPSKNPKIILDSVHLDMEKIAFYSKDSLHKLTIDEFSFKNNDIIFRHVKYQPTNQQKMQKEMAFSAPNLILRNVNLEALLKKKLVADQAELLKPLIFIDDRKRIIGKNSNSKAYPKNKKKTSLFMTLHQLKQMINVDQLLITGGTIDYKGSSKSNIVLNAKNLNAKIVLNKTLSSDSLIDIKHSIRKLEIGNINLKSDKFLLNLRNYKFVGLNRQNWVEKLNFHQNKNNIAANNVYWKAFDWDLFQKSKIIKVDSLHIDNVISDFNNNPKKRLSGHKKNLPAIHIAKLGIDQFLFNSTTSTNEIGFSGNKILLTDVKSQKNYFTWKDANLTISNFRLLDENKKADIAKINIKNNVGQVQNIVFVSNSDKGFQHIFLPSVYFKGNFNSTKPDFFVLESVSVDNGNIEILSKEKNRSQSFHTPKIPFLIKSAAIKNLKLKYLKEKDFLKFNTTVNLAAQNIRSFSESSQLIRYDKLIINLLDSNLDEQKLHLIIPQLTLQLKDGNLFRKNDLTTLSSGLSVNWFDAAFNFQKDSMRLQASNNNGSYIDEEFIMSLESKLDLKKITEKTNFNGGEIVYNDDKLKVEIKNYSWNSIKNKFQVANFSLHPILSREIFFKNSKYQDNYVEVKGDSASFSVTKLGKLTSDSIFSLKKINLDGLQVNISRDKTLPLKAAKHKLMPTQLISSLKIPFSIDTISLKNSAVIYKEFEVKSKVWSEIPFSGLNGNIINLSNQITKKDSLELNLSGSLFKADINRFSYRESYIDSLAGFNAYAHFSAIDLKDFSNISRPMGSLDITSGYAENLYSSWSGNQHAAIGNMNFDYDKLKVKFLNPEGKNGWHFSSKMKTFAANLVLPNSSHKSKLMFVERDPNKFVFNYWIKMQLSGILSTFGLKNDKKYLKKYNKNRHLYNLRDFDRSAENDLK